jgi:hypothetical protein
MKKLKLYFYWANHPCTTKFLVGEGFWFGLSNCEVGNPQLPSRRSLSSKAGDVNMKHFAQTLTTNLSPWVPNHLRGNAASLVRRLASLALKLNQSLSAAISFHCACCVTHISDRCQGRSMEMLS